MLNWMQEDAKNMGCISWSRSQMQMGPSSMAHSFRNYGVVNQKKRLGLILVNFIASKGQMPSSSFCGPGDDPQIVGPTAT